MQPDLITDAGEIRAAIDTALRGAFLVANGGHKRSPHSMSMSRLGGCTKAAAYAVAETPTSDEPEPEEGRAANLGTWTHEGLLPLLADQLPGSRYEQATTLNAAGLEIPGRIDLDWGNVVLDLKTVGERRLHGVRRAGPYLDHRVQVMGYALARLQEGRPVRWVVWLYLDRASGDHEVIVEKFTNSAALAVIDRVREIRGWATQPDEAPRDGRGPGLSLACDGCSWLRRCWGPDAVPGVKGAQRYAARDEPSVAAALALYDDASARGSAAAADQDYAKAMLDTAKVGYYGPWSLRRGKTGGARLDEAAVRARYADLGEDVPTKATAGRLLVRLTEALTKPMRAEIARSETVPDVDH